MLSFFFSWSSDQSEIKTIFDSSTEIKNIGKKFGLLISYYMIYKGFGLGAILIPSLMFLIGISFTFNSGLDKILSRSIFLLISMVWISLFSSYIFNNNIYGGVFGYEIKSIIIEFMGDLGFISILVFGFISFLIIKFKITPVFLLSLVKSSIKNYYDSRKSEEIKENLDEEINQNEDVKMEPNDVQPTIQNFSKIDQIAIDIEKIKDEETVDKNSVDLLKKFGEFDHTLDLKSFKQPEIKLLNAHDKDGSITINQEELEENKEKIIDTLRNYKIGIEKIKATIGPTVTLYEIIPEAGVRISKIKSLKI